MAQSGPFTEGEAAGATTNHWKKGDIAFLHWQDQWCHEDDIAMRRYVPYKATGRKYPPLSAPREPLADFHRPRNRPGRSPRLRPHHHRLGVQLERGHQLPPAVEAGVPPG